VRACLLIALVAALGCGDEARSTDKDVAAGGAGDDPGAPARTGPAAAPHEHPPAELSLAPHLPLVLTAPETAEVEQAPAAAVRVSTPDGSFALLIDDQPADLAAQKREIEANTINELKAFVVDEPAALAYESEAMPDQPEFHFVANVEVGDRTLSCRDETGPFWTRAQIDAMLAACRSLAPAE
jgi:hypothetical protein